MKKKLWIAGLAVAVLAAAVAAVLLLLPAGQKEAEKPGRITLYWNVEKAEYEDPATGVTKRRANQDGEYQLLLAADGTQQKFTCSDKKLVDTIDANYVMGLAVNEDGQITKAYTLDELGYEKTAWQFYVNSIADDGTVSTDSSKDLEGEQAQFRLTQDTQVYYAVNSDMLTGMPTDVRELDRVMGITDDQGRLSHLYIIGRTYTGTGEMRYCPHCDKEVKWWSWDNDTYLPEINGHFFVTTDIQLVRQCLVRADQSIVVDLQGHTVTGKNNNRIYATWGEGAYLGIMDSSAIKTGKLVTNGTQLDQGGCLWIRYGTVELFSGILDASSGYTLKDGAAVYLKEGATFNMYDGEIRGGISLARTSETGSITNGCGGNLYIAGTFNMYNGKITGGQAQGLTVGNSTRMGIGGNLYVTKTGVVNITGGTIENGMTTGPGANIYTNGLVNIQGDVSVLGGTVEGAAKDGGSIHVTQYGTLIVDGATISGGTTTGSGGNICSAGTVKLTNATVTDGTSGKYAGSVYATEGVLTITDSTVHGGTRAGKKVDFDLAGTVDITGLEVPNEGLINVDDLALDSAVTVTASGVFTEKSSNNCAACFKADGYSASVVRVSSQLAMGRYRCLCGEKEHESWCDGTKHLWLSWAERELLPTGSGKYFLVSSVTRKYAATLGSVKENKIVDQYLDLNGKTVTGTQGERIWYIAGGSSLTVTDTVGGAKVRTSAASKQAGGLFMVGTDAVLNIYGGTLLGAKSSSGAAAAGSVLGTLNLYRGTITGGNGNGNGGNLSVAGTLNLYGGQITDGTASNLGGNIYCTGKMNIYGGTISGGTAKNANSNNIVLLKGSETLITGGVIDGGLRQAGGAVLTLKDSPVITGSGVILADGVRFTIDGQLAETADVTVSKDGSWLYFADTQLADNAAAFTAPEGYDVLFDETRNQLYYQLHIEPETHSHGDDVQWTVWDGVSVEDGAHYFLPEGGLTMTGRATIKGAHITLCLNGQTLTGKANNRTFFIMSGGSLTICDCSEHQTGTVLATGQNKENGGNIMIGSGSTLNLQSGNIVGGNVATGKLGGNVHISGKTGANGVLNMTGGKIYGGLSADGLADGNVYVAGTLNMSGGEITGNVLGNQTTTQIILSGAARITGEQTNLCLGSGKLLQLDGSLTDEALIGITMADSTGVFTQATAAENADNFRADDVQLTVSHDGTALVLMPVDSGEDPEEPTEPSEPEEPTEPEEPAGHTHCYCADDEDHTHEQITWTAWNGDIQTLSAGGYFLLEQGVTLTDEIVLGVKDTAPAEPVNIYLCLNGKTLTAAQNKRVFTINSGYTVNICDCSQEKTGKISANGAVSGVAGLIQMTGGAKLNQYGGELTGGNATGNGGNVVMYSNSVYTMYGGKLTKGTSGNLGGNMTVGANSKFVMVDGEVSGGTAKTGTSHNILMAGAGTIELQGGYIQGGMRVTAGTVKLSGDIQIKDGTVSNLSVKNGNIIKIAGALVGAQNVGVSPDGTVLSTGVTEDVSGYFFCDNSAKTVTYNASTKELKVW